MARDAFGLLDYFAGTKADANGQLAAGNRWQVFYLLLYLASREKRILDSVEYHKNFTPPCFALSAEVRHRNPFDAVKTTIYCMPGFSIAQLFMKDGIARNGGNEHAQ
jgi:hypothetical protein